MDSRDIELFLRNRLTKPTEGRHFRQHGIPRPIPTRRPFFTRNREAIVCGILVAAVVAVFVLQLVYGWSK